MPNFEIKLIEDDELEEFCNLLMEMRPPIAGLKNKRIYKSIGTAAIRTNNAIIVIAKDDTRIVGFTITIIDWKKFWLKFSRLHPIIFSEIITHKIISKLRGNKEQKPLNQKVEKTKEFFASDPNKKSWSDSSPQIAKIVYTGVSKNYRKRGIGTMLGNYRFKILTERGVKRVDTNVDHQNIAIIKLNYNLGYKIYKGGNRLFLSKDL